MKILVADDSPSFRAALTRMLVEAGYEVVRARDGVEALSVFYVEQPDVVLLDLLMPRLTGWVVCRIIKEDPAFGRTPVLAITGADDPENRYWADRSGADAFVAKSEIADTLLDRVKAIVASRALADLATDGSARPVPEVGDVDVLARVCGLLDRKLFETTVVNDITSIAALTLDLRETLERTLATLHHLIEFDIGAIGLVDEHAISVWSPRRTEGWLLTDFRDRLIRHLDDAEAASIGSAAFTQWVGIGSDRSSTAKAWNTEYHARLTRRGRIIGSLLLGSTSRDAFDDRAHRTLRTVAPAIATVVDSARLHERKVARAVADHDRAAG